MEKEFTLIEYYNLFKINIKLIINKWKLIFLICFITALIGVLIAWLTPITYTSKLTFVLEEGKSNAGGLSSLAGQFGVDLNSITGSSNMLAGDNIIGLLMSKKMVEKSLLTNYDNSNQSLADIFSEEYNLQKKWKKKFGKKIKFSPIQTRHNYTRTQDSLLNLIEMNIIHDKLNVIRVDKKMSFIQVSSTLRNEKLNKLFTERLVNATIDFYIETKTRRQRENVNRLQKRADSIGGLLNSKTYNNAYIQSKALDVNPIFKTELVNVEVSSRDKLMLGTVYSEVVKQLEIQKATLTQETPTIQIVDDLSLPLTKNKKNKLIYLILGGFLGFTVSIAWVFIKNWFNTISKKQPF